MHEFLQFLEHAYTAYQAVGCAREILKRHGFEELDERLPWDVRPEGKYFVVRGGSAVIAFTGGDAAQGFKIVASHTDSPCLKLKENATLSDGNATRLNTEPYGGGLWYTFFDRPLRLAGRVVREEAGALTPCSFVSDFSVSLPSLSLSSSSGALRRLRPALFALRRLFLHRREAFQPGIHPPLPRPRGRVPRGSSPAPRTLLAENRV